MIATNRAISIAGVIMPFGVALLYLAQKSIFSTDPEIDFKYIWFAGELWNNGVNPYSDAFYEQGAAAFTDTNRLKSWLYPPNWWALSAFLALFNVDDAVLIWRSLNASMILLGSYLLYLTLKAAKPDTPLFVGALIFFFAATFQATPMTLAMGQTSILIFFGLCCLAYGLALKKPVVEIAGLVLIIFKPHIGIVAFAALIVLPQHRRSVLIATAISIGLSIPALLIGGVGPTIFGFLEQLGSHSELVVNAPPSTTGIRHLIFDLSKITISTIPAILVGGVVAAGLTIFLQRSNQASNAMAHPVFAIYIVSAIILTSIALAPLHSYDFVIAVPLIVFLFVHSRNFTLVALIAGYLLLFRASNLAGATGFSDPETVVNVASHLETLVAIVMFGAFVYGLKPFGARSAKTINI